MKRILSFDKMIMPFFIKLLFWIGVIGAIIFGLGAIVYGAIKLKDGGIGIMLGGVLILLIGPFVVRLYAEMLIVIFKLQESLIQIRDVLSEENQPGEMTRLDPEAYEKTAE